MDTGPTQPVEPHIEPTAGIDPTFHEGNALGAPQEVRRSTRERKQVVNYKPSMSGKQYTFASIMLATTELGLSFFNDVSYQDDAEVAYALFMQQLSLKAALKQWGANAESAGRNEVG